MNLIEVDWWNTDSIWHAHPSNHRLVPGGSEYDRYLFVRDQVEPGATVLDVGCNCGQLAVNLTTDHGCTVVGVDVVAEFVQHCRQEKAEWGAFHCLDFSRCSYRDMDRIGLVAESVDVVTALELIEHPIDVRGFRERVSYVLKRGGRLVITTPHPASPSGGYRYYREHAHHVRVWSDWRLEQVFGPMAARQDIHHKGVLCQIGAVFVKS